MAEKEYIEREAVCGALNHIGGCDAEGEWSKGWDKAIDTALGMVEYIPAADVAPMKRGHWESNEYLAGINMTRCSECKTKFYIQDLEEISGDGFVSYCSNCGADMRGEHNDP